MCITQQIFMECLLQAAYGNWSPGRPKQPTPIRTYFTAWNWLRILPLPDMSLGLALPSDRELSLEGWRNTHQKVKLTSPRRKVKL